MKYLVCAVPMLACIETVSYVCLILLAVCVISDIYEGRTPDGRRPSNR